MKKITCNEIAKAIKALMTMANISGHIEQPEGEPFRQFDVTSIEGNQDDTLMLINLGRQGFKLNISIDTDYKNSEE